MAGHSKWANIKHKKARNDAKRGQAWSKCAKAIIVAARQGGGDPAMNLTLRYAIEDAKSHNMPKDTIENAVKKGTGELEGVNYESVVYEGYGPGGVAIMLDILTDNRNRTAGEIRKLFDRAGGNLGASGCVAYLFQARGQLLLGKDQGDEDAIMSAALDAGAEDVQDTGESWQVLCEPGDLMAVREAMEQAGLVLEAAELTMIPDNTIACTGRDAQKLLDLVEELEDHDDVQHVYANFDIPDEELAALER